MSHNSIIRKIIVKLHLYTGLILGLIITLICLSGTAIVYKPELEKLSVKDIAFVKYNPQNEMFRLLGTKRSFSQNETFFFSHP